MFIKTTALAVAFAAASGALAITKKQPFRAGNDVYEAGGSYVGPDPDLDVGVDLLGMRIAASRAYHRGKSGWSQACCFSEPPIDAAGRSDGAILIAVRTVTGDRP